MQKVPLAQAAALAAILSIAVSQPAEARRHHPKHKTPNAATDARHPSVSRHSRAAAAGASRRHPARARSRAARKRAREKTVIHQNAEGRVVVERVSPAPPAPAATAAALALPPGAVLPEPQNYPPAPCDPQDLVLEAHMHRAATDGPEDQGAESAELTEDPVATAEPAKAGAGASLTRIARKLKSFLRPKSGESEVRPSDVDLTSLISESFLIPVEGVDAKRLQDSFLASRGSHARHLAIDIGAPRGTPILATTDGEITRISKERRGGNAIYQKDSTGQYLLFYCHLSRYADGIESGKRVRKGEVIGYVGSTGHVIGGPHLHFSITRVPEDTANFRKGLAINPYLLFLANVP
ncbi:MAG: M23 family metallopeptidase [Thermoanaerobaculia bacterium]